MKRLLQFKLLFMSVALVFMLSTGVNAQDNSAYGPAPDSKTLVRSIQNPVNYHTGVVNVQAPIYTVQAEGVSVPITLNYQTSGIKVEDKSTSVGLGWRLSSGGKITRIVKKYPDEKKVASIYNKEAFISKTKCFENSWVGNYLFLFNSKIDEVLSLNNSDEWNPCNGMYFNFDTEPDIFYFEIPGKSGIFVLDNNGVAHTIPYQDIDIQFSYNGEDDENYFTIKDNGGNTYKFGTKPESRELMKIMRRNNANSSNVEMTYNSTWWLDEIKPFAGEPVSFIYSKSESIKTIVKQDRFQVGVYEKNNGQYKMTEFQNDYVTSSEVAPSYLKTIKWNKGRAEFYYTTKRSAAINTTFELLERIKTFDYGYFPMNIFYLNYSFFSNGQIKLDSIMEEFGSDMQYLYKFAYSSISIPFNNDYFYDHWGYFNGRGNGSHNDYMPEINIGGISISGHSREPHPMSVKANSLAAVQTGNLITRYMYELNEVRGSSLYDVPYGGLRIRAILHIRGEKVKTIRHYKYTLADGKRSSGKAYERKNIYHDVRDDGKMNVYSKCINNLYDFGGNHISYSRVTEYLPDGSYNVYKYDEGVDCEDPEWSMYPAASLSDDKKLQMGYFAPPTSYFWRRGLLTTQESYNASGILFAKTENKYSFGPAKKIIKCLSPYEKEKCLFVYKWVSEPVFLAKTITHETQYNNRSETKYEYNTENMLPTKIITTDSVGDIYETKMQYSCDFKRVFESISSVGNLMVPSLKFMLNNNALNIPIETVSYKNGRVLSANLNLYIFQSAPDGSNASVKLFRTMNLDINESIPSSDFELAKLNIRQLGVDFHYDARYKPDTYYDQYDGYKLLSYHKLNGIQKSIIYDSSKKLPVASVENAVHSTIPGVNQVIYESFETGNGNQYYYAKSGEYVNYPGKEIYYLKLKDLKPGQYVISYWYLPSDKSNYSDWVYKEVYKTVNAYSADFPVFNAGGLYYDEVRVMPVGAIMSTCTYRPGVGKTSETDINGNTTNYKYNKFRMLKTVIDNEGIKVRSLVYDNYTSNE